MCSSRKHKFTPSEDERLVDLVGRLGESDWQNIARLLGGRSRRQCRERWKNYLAPNIKKDPWSPEEDCLLEEKVRELGSQWSLIARFFPLRTDVSIKNHWAVLVHRPSAAQKPEVPKPDEGPGGLRTAEKGQPADNADPLEVDGAAACPH
jgi:hypothetical protein